MNQMIAVMIGCAWVGVALAQEPIQGAKELFYDPTGTTATRVSPGSSASSPAGQPTTFRQPVHASAARDNNGRRPVTLPSTPEARASQKVLGLSYWIELMKSEGGPGTQVTEHRAFHSGERIRLHFRSNSDGNIALLQLGSSGTAQVLFPDPEKGLTESRLMAGEDKVLPHEAAWFRFDEKPGTEKLIVLFARSREDLDRFPLRQNLNEGETKGLVQNVRNVQGSKDLVVETETRKAGEIGTYGVNVTGQPVVLEITLEHH
ncbi:MAG TPA: DUF4384 domain-containing protein [Thermoanaerobaculia bacterium]|jgi:hypothetical protein|nr:DUF4384 domain-containing protein [Thermoanaerobaculia bacterium]